jgi:hypothetical protein
MQVIQFKSGAGRFLWSPNGRVNSAWRLRAPSGQVLRLRRELTNPRVKASIVAELQAEEAARVRLRDAEYAARREFTQLYDELIQNRLTWKQFKALPVGETYAERLAAAAKVTRSASTRRLIADATAALEIWLTARAAYSEWAAANLITAEG